MLRALAGWLLRGGIPRFSQYDGDKKQRPVPRLSRNTGGAPPPPLPSTLPRMPCFLCGKPSQMYCGLFYVRGFFMDSSRY